MPGHLVSAVRGEARTAEKQTSFRDKECGIRFKREAHSTKVADADGDARAVWVEYSDREFVMESDAPGMQAAWEIGQSVPGYLQSTTQ